MFSTVSGEHRSCRGLLLSPSAVACCLQSKDINSKYETWDLRTSPILCRSLQLLRFSTDHAALAFTPVLHLFAEGNRDATPVRGCRHTLLRRRHSVLNPCGGARANQGSVQPGIRGGDTSVT